MNRHRAAVIAHRGACGYLPEHTREAKMLAYGQGADFLEQDVVASRDRRLVVLHDLHLDEVTDVAARFPGRHRSDGRHYVIDFDFAELRQLRVFERRRPGAPERVFANRFRDDTVEFRIASLDDEIKLVRELNRATGREVGIYPEIKHPDFHRDHGVDLAAQLLEMLDLHGYRTRADAAVVQCFDAEELRRCREELGTGLRLAQLIAAEAGLTLPASDVIARIAGYADIIAPHYSQLVTAGEEKGEAALAVAPQTEAARSAGLALHPYTFRRDALPTMVAALEPLLEFFFVEVGVAAVFCDHPDIAVAVRDRSAGSKGG